MITIILLFVGIPILVAVLAKIAHNLFFPLTRTKKYSSEIDHKDILVTTSQKISVWRKISENGNDIVFVHHLAPLVNEYRKTVIKSVIKTLLFEFILIFVLAIGAAQNQTNTDISASIMLIADQWKMYYIVPLGMTALCLEFILYYYFLYEQITKYELTNE